ncbi:YiiX family permuted papain-like enzyme [Flavobacterium wongokense]|uniref:YiiX family permuted papain-like enzyme n=1 Tax=Flavobacterium wongokense TaxID=2910674 RepID=UPI001F2D04ED|nr:YiiX family permuted papain-like enzyme [Flavobacterium sp. WG47]MCF6133216.1 YiiX family permuted papain-like enzyme [Flavobacterium sp. WG47]
MKKVHIFLALILLSAFGFIGSSCDTANKKNVQSLENVKDGDIIFQSSQSGQCEAIRIATNSKFSHCGIIYIVNGKKYVYEAVQPVSSAPLEQWIKHGEGNAFVIKRLKNAATVLDAATLKKMKDYGSKFNNKDYDLYFGWSDDKIYCSELVWKIYKNGANIELCKLASLKNFNLDNPKVKAILAERYGNRIPLEEQVVAPSQIESSALLETVIDTYK